MKPLEHYWYHANIFVWLLLPLSWLFCTVAVIRRKLYQLNIFTSVSAQVPVVVVGNIVVGGSGKTPLLITLCEFIKQKGYQPGVVSRGYGGNYVGLRQVQKTDSAELVGDEPLMIHQRTGVPVVVAADRVAAVDALISNNQCDIIFSDDGLQHYRMQRELEVAVVDANRRFGNGFCLPAGPLREPVSRLAEVDLIVYNQPAAEDTEDCSYRLVITDLYKLDTGESRSLESFTSARVHAVAGIGDPGRFFAQLRGSKIDIIGHAFPDHHTYKQHDFSGWDSDCIIMTEKDAVKCRALTLPDAWVVQVRADMSETLASQLGSKLLPLLAQKIS